MKQGEIDWLHIVPEISWMGQERVVTRLIKLCRVAHRRGIWWSIENPATSELWRSNRVRSLCEEGDVEGFPRRPCSVMSVGKTPAGWGKYPHKWEPGSPRLTGVQVGQVA